MLKLGAGTRAAFFFQPSVLYSRFFKPQIFEGRMGFAFAALTKPFQYKQISRKERKGNVFFEKNLAFFKRKGGKTKNFVVFCKKIAILFKITKMKTNKEFSFYEPVIEYKKRVVESVELNCSDSSYSHLSKFYASVEESFYKEVLVLVGLNSRNKVKFTKVISIGTDRQCLVSVRDILKECLIFNCSAFIIAHNHPSGDPTPSAADLSITRKIKEASQIMDISFADHMIIGEKTNDPTGVGYYSMRSAGHI